MILFSETQVNIAELKKKVKKAQVRKSLLILNYLGLNSRGGGPLYIKGSTPHIHMVGSHNTYHVQSIRLIKNICAQDFLNENILLHARLTRYMYSCQFVF